MTIPTILRAAADAAPAGPHAVGLRLTVVAEWVIHLHVGAGIWTWLEATGADEIAATLRTLADDAGAIRRGVEAAAAADAYIVGARA